MRNNGRLLYIIFHKLVRCILYIKCLYKWKKCFLFSQSIYEYFILSDRLT